MRTLNGWIVGIFGLGLGLGGFMMSSASISRAEPSNFQAAIDNAPLVDCGEGREALLEPVLTDEGQSFKVRCVGKETDSVVATPEVFAEREPRVQVVRVETVPAPAQVPAPVVVHAPMERSESAVGPTEADRGIEVEPTQDERTWKQRAVVIGGAAGTGTVIGGIAKGKKGAAVGAAIGAASGAVYELLKKDRNKN